MRWALILRQLLVGRVDCEAFDEGTRVGYRFKARGSYANAAACGPVLRIMSVEICVDLLAALAVHRSTSGRERLERRPRRIARSLVRRARDDGRRGTGARRRRRPADPLDASL